MFDVSKVSTFKAFNAKGAAFVANVVKAHSSLSKIVLMAGIIQKAQSPDLGGRAIAEQVMDNLKMPKDLGKSYKAMLAKVMTRDLARFIAVNGDEPEAAIIAKAHAFAEANSLRGLYDEGKPTAEQREADKAKAKEEAKAAKAETQKAMGIAADAVLPQTMDVVKLQKTLAPWLEAAERGEENAIAVLAALAAQIGDVQRKGRAAQKAARKAA